MYRESLPGLALAATLQELSASLTLTDAQTESLWHLLDRTVETALADAPVMSRIRVRCPPPSLEDLLPPPAEEASTVALTDGVDEAHVGGVAATGACSADCDVVFPVYRRVGDTWTLLLKNPTVEVRDDSGAEETLRLDYLKVHLRAPAASAPAKEPRGKRPRAQ